MSLQHFPYLRLIACPRRFLPWPLWTGHLSYLTGFLQQKTDSRRVGLALRNNRSLSVYPSTP